MWNWLFTEVVAVLVELLDLVGIGVILGSFIIATGQWVRQMRQVSGHQAYVVYRRRSVRGLILGLEFLVAADIIRTVTIDYTVESLMMLGLIVIIRTFLVFALHIEIDGRLPWRAPDDREPKDGTD